MAKQAAAHSSIAKPRLPAALGPEARKLVEQAIDSHLAAVEGLHAALAQLPGDPELDGVPQEQSPTAQERQGQCAILLLARAWPQVRTCVAKSHYFPGFKERGPCDKHGDLP